MNAAAQPQSNGFSFDRLTAMACLAAVIISFYPMAILVGESWSNSGDRYGHGWLVFLVAAYLLYDAHDKTLIRPNGPLISILLTLFIVGSGVVVHLAHIMTIQVLTVNPLPLILLALIYLLFGPNYARRMLLPCLYFYCGLPIWNYINPVLQSVTSYIVGHWMTWSGIPITIDGNFITIPSGKFEIAEGCSGFKYFISSLATALLYVYLYAVSARSKIFVLALGIGLALLSNWIRVFIVILVGHFTEMQSSIVEDHDNLGWVIYGISLVPFILIANKFTLRWDKEYQSTAKHKANENSSNASLRIPSAVLITGLIALTAPALAFHTHRMAGLTYVPTAAQLSSSWETVNRRGNDWSPAFPTADEYSVSSYRNDAWFGLVDVHLGQFKGLPAEGDRNDYRNQLITDGWSVSTTKTELVENQAIKEMIITNRFNQRVLIYHWDQSGTSIQAGLLFSLVSLKEYLQGRHGHGFVGIASLCLDSSCALAQKIAGAAAKEILLNKK